MVKRILIPAALLCAAVVLVISLRPSPVARAARERPPAPLSRSRIEGVTLENIRYASDDSGADLLYDVVNSTDKQIVYFTVRSGAYTTSIQFDAGHGVAPRSAFTHRIEQSNVKRDAPLILAAIAFADGEERGAGRDIERMRRHRGLTPKGKN